VGPGEVGAIALVVGALASQCRSYDAGAIPKGSAADGGSLNMDAASGSSPINEPSTSAGEGGNGGMQGEGPSGSAGELVSGEGGVAGDHESRNAGGAGEGAESGEGVAGVAAGIGGVPAGTGGGAGMGGAGASGASQGGTSGSGAPQAGGPPHSTTPPPGILGTVRVLVDGSPRCGGTLISNSWVLTADQCLDAATPAGAVQIGYGGDSTNFEQTHGLAEVMRFPGNDGTAEQRGRDLLLLGADSPFIVDGEKRGHHRSVTPMASDYVLSTQRCVGWDLDPDPESDTLRIRSALITGALLQTFVAAETRPLGHRVWWMNTAPDPHDGVLPMHADIGTSCFWTLGQTNFLTTVHSGNPALKRDGLPNVGRESYSQVLAEPAVREWLESSLFSVEEEALELGGEAGTCSLAPDTFELFARRPDGTLGFWHWRGGFEAEPPISPPSGVALSGHRPGVLCTRGGAIELLVVDEQGGAWRRTREADEKWSDDWERVEDARTAIASGLAIASAFDGHFHVFAVDANTELRHAEFNGGWTGRWDGLSGGVAGTPVARMGHKSRMDVFVNGTDQVLWQLWRANDTWQEWVPFGAAGVSVPAVTSWAADRVDLWVRSGQGTLLRKVYDSTWADWVDTGILAPDGNFIALTSEVGHVDVLVTGTTSVWHARWPRVPGHAD
jgi:hypothetical protein